MPNFTKHPNNLKSSNWRLAASLTLIAGLLLIGCNLLAPAAPAAVSSAPATATSGQVTEAPTAVIPDTPTAEIIPPTATLPPQRVEVLPDPAGYAWQVFAEGFTKPVGLTHAGDGSGRVFVVERAGLLWALSEGVRAAEPFLDLRSQTTGKGEQGLLGLAFHPDYASNGFFFVDYTDLNGDTVVARFQVSADPNKADPASERVLLQASQPYQNHNGGQLAFGPDGYLYIGLGDGGSGGDPHGNGQNLNTFLGKILRIDVNAGDPYAIPPDNPFASQSGALPEIWLYGLRNPWRFSFDRATGDLWIGDVGQGDWEEVDLIPAGLGGLNLGWNYFEGSHTFQGEAPASQVFISPVIDYSHAGGNCSVSSGYVYRGAALPDWQGVYLFGDYCSGLIWGALPDEAGLWQPSQMFQLAAAISSFGEDEAGELYLIDLNGTVYRLEGQ